jgi:hypothetical protein
MDPALPIIDGDLVELVKLCIAVVILGITTVIWSKIRGVKIAAIMAPLLVSLALVACESVPPPPQVIVPGEPPVVTVPEQSPSWVYWAAWAASVAASVLLPSPLGRKAKP